MAGKKTSIKSKLLAKLGNELNRNGKRSKRKYKGSSDNYYERKGE